jgi:hypothetical protein
MKPTLRPLLFWLPPVVQGFAALSACQVLSFFIGASIYRYQDEGTKLPTPTQAIIDHQGLAKIAPIIIFISALGLHFLAKRSRDEVDQSLVSASISAVYWIGLIVITSGILMAALLPILGK